MIILYMNNLSEPTILIGSKILFGVEFTPIAKYENKRGRIKVWINNFAIGNPLEDDFFSVFLDQLEYIVSNAKMFSELENNSSQEIFSKMIENENHDYNLNFDGAIVQLGESFDNYLIRSLRASENKIKIIIAAKNMDENNVNKYNIISITLGDHYLIRIISDLRYQLKNEFNVNF